MTVTQMQGDKLIDSAGVELLPGSLVVVGIQATAGTIRLGKVTGQRRVVHHDEPIWAKPWDEHKFEVEWVQGTDPQWRDMAGKRTWLNVGSKAHVYAILGMATDYYSRPSDVHEDIEYLESAGLSFTAGRQAKDIEQTGERLRKIFGGTA